MIIAPGSQAGIFDGADPLAGSADLQLKSATGGQAGEFFVHARIVGPDDKPIVGASVKPDGVGTGTSTSWGNTGFPSETFTGLNGEFIMSRDQRFTRMSVNIKAADLAPAKVWLPTSNGVQTIRLVVGATLTGRVLKDGRPMADIDVGVSGANRNSEVYAGRYEAKTDAEGRFRFEHLPPETEWYFYGLMRSLRRDGSLPPKKVTSAADGQSTDLGDLAVQPSVTLAGQVKTKNGEPIPSNLRITVSYDSAGDSQSARVDRTGAFELTGLHPGQMDVYLNASSGTMNWFPSAENQSLDEWNSRSLTGILNADKRDMLLVIERRDRNYNSYSGNNGYLPDADRSRNLPLVGAEPSGAAVLFLAGTIVDDATGQPILNVQITPGRLPKPTNPVLPNPGLLQSVIEAVRPRPRAVPWNERPFWENQRVMDIKNGRFAISLRPLSSQPILRLEADGYHTLETEPFTGSNSNLVLRLKKGSGPKGTLLGVNGQPASGVNVIFGAEQEQFSLNADGTLTAYGNQRSQVVTAADGTFSFPSKPNGRKVFAADETGWASVSVGEWPADGRIRLEAWAKVSGTLVDGDGKPVPNTQFAIESNRNFQEGDSWVNFQERPTTDGQGRFQFERVPPGPVRLVFLVPMQRGGGWMHAAQTNFTVSAGKTLDLGSMVKAPFRQF
jgi:hypothetical protein